jgi:parvulin-like peptidyl-prolyl isomerase
VLKQAGPTPVALPSDQRKLMQMQALGMLIDDLLMHQFLAQYAPQVPEQEVDKKILEMTEALRKQNKTLRDLCQESGTSEAAIRKDILSRLRWNAYAKGKISDADVEKYYKDCKDFFDGITVHASHIVVRTPAGTPDSERAKAFAQLAELRKLLVEKKIDFAEAAKKYSQCPTAPNGGDIGWIQRKFQIDDALARAAFATPVGQVTDVVQSDYGLHLILVTERKDGKPSDFTKIKDEVRQMCMEDMWQSILGQLRKAAKIEINLP